MEGNFVGEVADNLKCIVCLLVLKNPVLIVKCGHRLCKACYESVRDHSTKNRTPLLCPHDRQSIEPDEVVAD